MLDGDNAIASLACHYTTAHQPTAVDIERNEHFARLIAITLKDAAPASARRIIFVQPEDAAVREPRPAAAY